MVEVDELRDAVELFEGVQEELRTLCHNVYLTFHLKVKSMIGCKNLAYVYIFVLIKY